jgi:hypothetical protein
MRAFELVTIVVSVVAIGLALTSYFRVSRVLQRLGRHGQVWFDRVEDIDPPERPSDDDRDDPLPRRPLRGRPEP